MGMFPDNGSVLPVEKKNISEMTAQVTRRAMAEIYLRRAQQENPDSTSKTPWPSHAHLRWHSDG